MRPEVLDHAVSIMSTLNRAASEAMVKVGVNACTDITGFGLIGHLNGMMQGSGTSAKIRLSGMPVIPGVWELIGDGIAPGGTHRNLSSAGPYVEWGEDISEDAKLLLCDAQTSGGLLISVPEQRVNLLLEELDCSRRNRRYGDWRGVHGRQKQNRGVRLDLGLWERMNGYVYRTDCHWRPGGAALDYPGCSG